MARTYREVVSERKVPSQVIKMYNSLVASGMKPQIDFETKKEIIKSKLKATIREYSDKACTLLTIPLGLGIPKLGAEVQWMIEEMAEIAFGYTNKSFSTDIEKYIPKLVKSLPFLLIPGIGIGVAGVTVEEIGNDFMEAIIEYYNDRTVVSEREVPSQILKKYNELRNSGFKA